MYIVAVSIVDVNNESMGLYTHTFADYEEAKKFADNRFRSFVDVDPGYIAHSNTYRENQYIHYFADKESDNNKEMISIELRGGDVDDVH